MRFRTISILSFLTIVLTACAQFVPPTAVPAGEDLPTVAPTPAPTDTAEPAILPTPTSIATIEPKLLPEEEPPAGAASQFKTDFGRHSVPYTEILSGGPPKDGIPAIDRPQYTTLDEADEWLKPQEPVISLEIDGQARAYPIQVLMWHEIANDVLGRVPVAVTFCPLCNTAIVFDRRLDGQVLDFGTTGRLRYSNLVMYDRQSETWWQQATGEGIAGEHTGQQLAFLPAAIVSWQEFQESRPDGDVLSRETGHARSYGRNPYSGYDDVNRDPFLYTGPETPDKLPPMARVATVDLGGEAVAYPYSLLQDAQVINDTVDESPIVVLWQPGTASALDAGVVAEGRDVGSVNTFRRDLGGQELTFRFDEGRIVDEQTASEWTVLGEAIDGPLAGRRLEPIVHINHFWFSWAAFKPETRVYRAREASDAAPPPVLETASVEVGYDFEIGLYQDGDGLVGEQIQFSDLFSQGKPVLINLYAGLCPICRFELPKTQELYDRYGDDVVFLGVDIGPFTGLGGENEGRALLADLGISFPAGNTPDAAIMREYRVVGVPEILLFSSDGEIVDRWSGIPADARLEEHITSLLDI
jgi:thiol-disulfide isomerase/thioredoxin